MSITLAEIRTQARQRADMLESRFVSESELTNYINNSLAELHDLLIGAYCEDYVMQNVSFATATNVVDYELPNGTNYDAAPKFYKMRGVDMRVNTNQWSNVHRFNFNRRNADLDSFAFNLAGLPYLEYRVVGSNIRFSRTPDTGTEIRLWYYPKAVVLVNETDSYDDVNGYAEYIIVDAAIKMMQKEESDVQVLMAQKAALKQRIEDMAQNRDANEPETVSDIYIEDTDVYWITRR